MPILTRSCPVSGQNFQITDEDQAFYTQMGVPLPTLCPEERKRRRLAWANMWRLHTRSCDATGKTIISKYVPHTTFPVFANEYWWSDAYDPMKYGRDYDFSKPFFEQFRDLLLAVPRPSLTTSYETLENSDYINYASYLKNCYLVFHTSFSEDSYYGVGIKYCRDTVDCLYVYYSELCYQCIECRNCYNLKFSKDCRQCSSSWFLRDCNSCNYCFGCVNLANKEYFIFNEQKTQQEYETFIAQFNSKDPQVLKEMETRVQDLSLKFSVPAFHGSQNENVSGDYLYECQNVQESFHVSGARDCKFCERFYDNCANCYDVDQFGHNSQLLYECECCGLDAYNLRFCSNVRNASSNVFYSDNCFATKDSFGCVGFKKGQFCILNKQYSEAEYRELLPRVIEHMKSTGEWGEFFPTELSLFAYNESIAQDYFPLTREQVLERGWAWQEEPDPKRPFRITAQEMKFYEKLRLPVPTVHPEERIRERFRKVNPSRLYDRVCAKTGVPIQTSYSPGRPEMVVSEEVYLKEKF